jgi:DNA modification methylase
MADKGFDFKQIRKRVIRKVDDLIPYERNPRINADAVPLLKESIRRFGMNVPPVITKDNVLVTGHTRLKACKELGITEVECVLIDDLSPAEIKAFRLADNKIPEYSGWDFDLLDVEMKDIAEEEPTLDMADLGFLDDPSDDAPEEDALGADEEEKTPEVVEETAAQAAVLPDETRTEAGDVYILGRHRLICGDSTDPQVIGTLMDGVTADIVFTSPPYNAETLKMKGHRAETGKKYLEDEQVRSEDEYGEFLIRSVNLMLEHAKEAFYDIGLLSGSKKAVIRLLNAEKDRYKDQIYWKKSNPVPAAAKNIISSAVEPIFAFGRNPSRSFEHDPGLYYGVIEGPAATSNPFSKYHRATFPLYLPEEVIKTFTDDAGTVLDPFGGTGTTLIACEELGRTCYMAELEPKYCDLIVQRYIAQAGSADGVRLLRNGREVPFTQ